MDSRVEEKKLLADYPVGLQHSSIELNVEKAEDCNCDQQIFI